MFTNLYVKNKRLALGLTQKEVAEMADVSHTIVSNLEDPVKNLQVTELYKKAVINTLNERVHKLDKLNFYRVKLVENALCATEPNVRDGERDLYLASVIQNASKLQLEIINERRRNHAQEVED